MYIYIFFFNLVLFLFDTNRIIIVHIESSKKQILFKIKTTKTAT